MPAIKQFYLRLCLVQGVALAAGFWFHAQLQPGSQANSSPVSSEQSPASPRNGVRDAVRSGTVAWLGTWCLLAGVTGVLCLREQRDRLRELLQRFDDEAAPEPALSLLESAEASIPSTYSLPLPEEIVPRPAHLKLADFEDEFTPKDCCVSDSVGQIRLSLHS